MTFFLFSPSLSLTHKGKNTEQGLLHACNQSKLLEIMMTERLANVVQSQSRLYTQLPRLSGGTFQSTGERDNKSAVHRLLMWKSDAHLLSSSIAAASIVSFYRFIVIAKTLDVLRFFSFFSLLLRLLLLLLSRQQQQQKSNCKFVNRFKH